jgi:serine/threonine protein phosphatase PrpC
MIAGNVGDSPIYLIRDNDIELISTLHTVMAEQEALAPEGAKPIGSQFRHMLTRAVGTRETVRVDTVEIQYRAGDIVVICSDGLSDLVTPEEVCDKATSLQPEKACQSLTELANERGGMTTSPSS